MQMQVTETKKRELHKLPHNYNIVLKYVQWTA